MAKEYIQRATCIETLSILVQAKGKSIKAKEIVKELQRYGYKTNTRELAEHSKQLRSLGYRCVSDKNGVNGGYSITDDRDKLVHQDRMLKSIQDAVQIEREVVWKLIEEYDKEYPTLPCER